MSKKEKVPEQPDGWFWEKLPDLMEFVVAPIYRRWGSTWDHHVYGLDNLREAKKQGSFILSSFHTDLTIILYTLRDLGLVALVSPVYEGELIARVMDGLGYNFARGSSGFSPNQGMRQIAKNAKNGNPVAFSVDGPSGPGNIVKPGVISAAALTGKPIVPMLCAGKTCLTLPGWDKQQVPLPFTKTAFSFGKPINIPRRINKEETQQYANTLQDEMLELKRWTIDQVSADSK